MANHIWAMKAIIISTKRSLFLLLQNHQYLLQNRTHLAQVSARPHFLAKWGIKHLKVRTKEVGFKKERELIGLGRNTTT